MLAPQQVRTKDEQRRKGRPKRQSQEQLTLTARAMSSVYVEKVPTATAVNARPSRARSATTTGFLEPAHNANKGSSTDEGGS